jgi:3alpha(or 20beta)-hydroxysteroid dehydrogenase
MTDTSLKGRKALVTGGAQGLGEGMARALAAAGAKVGVADLQDDLGAKVAESLGPEHGFVHLDVTDDGGWEAAVTQVVDLLGGLDIVVNNAGVEITSLLVDLDSAAARKQLEVNLLGTALGIKHALRAMRPGGSAGGGGVVINVASVAATIAFPGIGVYSATKSGRRRRSARSSGSPRRAASARSPTWPPRWCSWLPTPRASSTASAYRSMAGWGCDHATRS